MWLGTNYAVGLVFSFVGHIVLFYLILFGAFAGSGEFFQPVIYSVTLDGGKELGLISQVPKDEKPVEKAPPKAATEPIKEEREEKKDDAEVSIKEAQPTPAEIAKPTPTPKVKATPKPTLKPTPKPTPKELSKAERDKKLEQALQRYRGASTDAGGQGFGAGKIGGNGMGGAVVMSPEFFAYKGL